MFIPAPLVAEATRQLSLKEVKRERRHEHHRKDHVGLSDPGAFLCNGRIQEWSSGQRDMADPAIHTAQTARCQMSQDLKDDRDIIRDGHG